MAWRTSSYRCALAVIWLWTPEIFSNPGEAVNCDSDMALRLNAAVTVEGRRIELKDVLTPLSASCLPDEIARTAVTTLYGVNEGYVSKTLIHQALVTTGIEALAERSLLGADRVLVRIKLNSVEPDALIAAAKEHLLRELTSRFDLAELRVEFSGRNRVRVRDKGGQPEDFRLVWTERSRPLPQEAVWVEILEHGELADRFPLWFEISAKQRVHVLAKNVYRYNHLHDNLVSAEYRDIAEMGGNPFVLPANETAFQFRGDYRAGAILTDDMLRPTPAVQNGSLVVVKVSAERVTLEALALASSDADVGETVRLRSPSSQEYFRAKVVGRNTAIVVY